MRQYFNPKKFEFYKSKSIYEFLGIKWFKKYLITDGDLVRRWKNVKQISARNKDRFNELYKAERNTKKYEIIHLIFLLIFILIVGMEYENISTFNWVIILLINLYANIYPIFLQRYNRIRIIRVLTKNGYKSPYE
ncbi:hypothetical protein [Galbibacter sp. EGI 63066]|uniref:glycosyl-4,4'-diaponeurosporenoate acyltransferase CrtO family protein n=1 Tax=Galbibacter sp. EGI 63066 TaxID=2993559 RepID=UPI003A521239